MANDLLIPDFSDPPEVDSPNPLEEIVPIATIRAHTKTNDVPAVTDAQLALYREAAFESAEQYTGLLLRVRRQIIEHVVLPTFDATHHGAITVRRWVKHRLRWGSADGVVWVYGGTHGRLTQRIDVAPGAREVRIPTAFLPVDQDECCRPCSVRSNEARVLYNAGFSPGMIPAGIKIGVLKWIAWTIENPGDVFRAVDDTLSRSSGTALRGTNNTALASGALDQWRQYRNIV